MICKITEVFKQEDFIRHVNYIMSYFEKEKLSFTQGIVVLAYAKKFAEEETGHSINILDL